MKAASKPVRTPCGSAHRRLLSQPGLCRDVCCRRSSAGPKISGAGHPGDGAERVNGSPVRAWGGESHPRATQSAQRTSPCSWPKALRRRGRIGGSAGPTFGSPSTAPTPSTPCARPTAGHAPGNGSESPAAAASAAQEPPLPHSPSLTACRRSKPSPGSGPTTTTAPRKPRGNDCGYARSSNQQPDQLPALATYIEDAREGPVRVRFRKPSAPQASGLGNRGGQDDGHTGPPGRDTGSRPILE